MPGPRVDAHPHARLSVAGSPICTPDWLALREPADAAARSPELATRLAAHLAVQRAGDPGAETVVRDLGCGSGSMGRWLAPRLSGAQRWILHDRDTELLGIAASTLPAGVATAIVDGDVADELEAALRGDGPRTHVVVASALLDLLTADEVERLAATCAAARCAVLLALQVSGSVTTTPSDALDDAFGAAFDAHQRRTVDGRRLLGPDATDVAVTAFARHGYAVHTAPSPWRLGADQHELVEEWMRGWLEAAIAHRPDLAQDALPYLEARLAQSARGELDVVVRHADLLALPGGAS